MIFNDSWAAKAAHLTTETMQMYEILVFSIIQGPPVAPHPIDPKEIVYKSMDFQRFLGRQCRPPHR